MLKMSVEQRRFLIEEKNSRNRIVFLVFLLSLFDSFVIAVHLLISLKTVHNTVRSWPQVLRR